MRRFRANLQAFSEMSSQRFDVTAADVAGQLFPVGAQHGFVFRREPIEQSLADAALGDRDLPFAFDGHPQDDRQLAAHA